jgi:catechol 2,3-dioxygenase-like lactoylglutathione lyase family enzyme
MLLPEADGAAIAVAMENAKSIPARICATILVQCECFSFLQWQSHLCWRLRDSRAELKYRIPVHRVKTRVFDHIDLRVRDRVRAQKFYSQILPALGFTRDRSEEEWGAFYAGDEKQVAFFAFDENKKHSPNENRIAFWADSREEVDRVAEIVRRAGGRNLEGPQVWPEYSPGYYALFFEDPDGNKLEVCCRGRAIDG